MHVCEELIEEERIYIQVQIDFKMSSKKRRSSIETIERFVKDAQQSPAEHARERRVSLTMMNCIWARNTDVETVDPVSGDITGKTFSLEIIFSKTSSVEFKS